MHSSLGSCMLIVWIVFSAVTVSAQSGRTCTIKQLIGTVEVRRGSATVWNSARVKMGLREGDAVRTFIESEVELQTGEGTLVKVKENSTMELGSLKGDEANQNTSVKILNGSILANVKKLVTPGSSFEFETPTATAAIRGTILGIEVDKNETRVKVFEGKVAVRPQGAKNETELEQNQMAVVQSGSERINVKPLDEKPPNLSLPIPADSAVAQTSDTTDTAGATGTRADSTKVGQGGDTQKQPLVFKLTSPADGQEFAKPLIPVSGSVTPGAGVVGGAIRLNVTPSGSFSGQIPIADESGVVTLEFEASLNGSEEKTTRRIIYKPGYRFVVTSPYNRQVITGRMLNIKGEVHPADVEVSVMGARLAVTPKGVFSGILPIGDEEGEMTLDFEITGSDLNKTERVTIVRKKTPDTYRPQISASISNDKWNIMVLDRTVDDELTLRYEIDGIKESRSVRSGEMYGIPLAGGVHSYRVYAEDRQKNLSAVETLSDHPFLSGMTWLIRMRKPAGNITIDIPPASPANEPSIYTVEFTIEKLPDDDMRLIREVVLINKTSGKRITLRKFTDNFLEADVELVRGKINQFQIDARDINGMVKSHTFQINAR